jgi:amino acid adenylation domain-containing protein
MKRLLSELLSQGIDAEKLKAWAKGGEVPAPLLAKIKENREGILEYLRTRASLSLTAKFRRPPISRVERVENSLPLSFAQQRLWFIDQLDSGSTHYNMPAALKVQGRFDEDLAEQAFRRIIERHEPLRTIFVRADEQPTQVIREAFEFTLRRVDLRGIARAQQDALVQEAARADAATGFDLAGSLMLRAGFLRLSGDEGVLLVNMHHIASDGWSMGLLTREFVQQYGALSRGQHNPLAPLTVRYADYAQWQRNWLVGEVLEQQLGYWDKQLAGLPAVHSVPLDRPRPARQSVEGARHVLMLDAATLRDLRQLAQDHQATLFMVLHAALSVLLARYGNSNDIVIGTPVANRLQKELEDVIGFFVNTLVLRTDCSDNPRFVDFLSSVKTVNLDAQANQDVPFEYLVERIKPSRSGQYSPLFQIMFSLGFNNGTDVASAALNDVSFTPLENGDVPAKFELLFNASESPTGLALSIDYNIALFEASTIERLAGSLALLLKGIVGDPATPIHVLPLLSKQTQHHLLRTLNATQTPYPRDKCIHELFETQVARTPSNVAVLFEDKQISYAELNARANRLAHYLREQGVRADTLVGLCVERSIEMVVGMFGILKAGGAYVPLDPGYPSARLSYMLENSKLSLLLTQQSQAVAVAQFVGEGNSLRVECLDSSDFQDSLQRYPASDPARMAGQTSSSLAYVIYTSGSTGLPKGVMNEHCALVNRIDWMQREYGLIESDAVLQKTPFSFDVSVWELTWPFTAGASLVMAKPEGHKDPAYLVRLILERGVTTLHFVPSMLQAMLDYPGWSDCRSVRQVFCSGEALLVETVKRHYAMHRAALHNLYGPTEAAIDVSFWACSRDSDLSIISIGKPIQNIGLYVLNSHQQPQPFGTAGELYIGGTGLARGYLNREDATAERFIANPFHDPADPGSSARLYKTGDLVRYLPDGNLEYLGRIDDQIKIRGFRIELGEIEHCLLQHERVKAAVVLGQECVPGEKRLVAYVACSGSDGGGGDQELAAAVRTHLRTLLPEYMVPAVFMVLPALPLNANGKIDKKTLPAPEQITFATRVYEPPSGMIETRLALSWQDLLGVQSVGRHDDFFELGGHSLLATRVVSMIRSEFGAECPLRALFEASTVALLARRVEALLQPAEPSTMPAIEQADRNGPLPLSYSQLRLWLLNLLEPASTLYNMPAAIALKGRLDLRALFLTLNEVVRRHEALRTRFAIVDRTPVQIISPTLEVPLPLIDLSGLDDIERQVQVQAELANESHLPFDLDIGPLIRARVIRLAADEHLLLFNMHHIISDGWSIGVLTREVTTIYGAYVEGRASPLPELAVQYADFAQWQRKHLSGNILARLLSYWHEQLDGAPALLTLPTDRPRPAVQSHRGATMTFTVPQSLGEGLHALSKRHGATLFMTLTAAFGLLLSRYAGQSDVCIGTPIANRNRTELESMIGLFINTLVLRVRLADAHSFTELLAQVREMALGAYAHQDLPFEYLLDELQPPRNTSHSPLFQAMLVLQNAPGGKLELPGLSWQPMASDTGGAKSEIAMYVTTAGAQIQITLSYRTDLFDSPTINEMGERFLHIAAQVCADPSLPLDSVTLVKQSHTPEAGDPALIRRSQQFAAREPFADCEIEQSLYARFRKQVELYPHKTAVVGPDAKFTYAELDRNVSALAAYITHVVGRGNEQIAMLFEHSASMVVAVLAALKAGKAYVPLDPTYPRARLEFILSDSQSTLLLTDSNNLAFAQELAGASLRVAVADDAWRTSLPDSLAACGPDTLAYILYTSGSTGQPKGVVQNHRNALYFCKSYANNLRISTHDRIVLFASYSFDASVMDIFGALLNGASLIVIGPKYKTSDELAEALIAHQVSILHATPTLYRYILESAADLHTSAVELVVLGGEPVSAADVALYKKRFKADCMLVNGYGPTESTLATQYIFHNDGVTHAGKIPAGFPIDGTTILLNDPHSRAGAFLSGEIVIKSPHVALGYWNNPELTARAFGTDEAGNRYYRTGDLGRYVSGQSIMVSGRIDHQVKIRGFRIEITEIEAALASLACIQHVVVVAQERTAGEKMLAAFITLREGAEIPGQDQLRKFALRSLPEYMVPACFVVVDEFPLTASGKIDRGALLHRQIESRHALAQREPTETDKKLMAIWRDVLQIQELGTDDNFLSLGGNSLRIMKLKLQIEHTFGVHVELGDLFNATSLSMLSDHIDELQTLVRARAAEVRADEEAIDF